MKLNTESNFKSIIPSKTQVFNNHKKQSNVSFKGAETKAAKTFAEKVAHNKSFIRFCKLADDNPALAEAIGALFITCGIRPIAIMALPKKDVDKNRKAASHSIASGIMGVMFAQILYTPFSKAVSKIKKSIDQGHPEKYIKKNSEYLLKAPIKKTVNGVEKTISNYDCFKQLATYGPKLFTATILATMTVELMPYIDKYIIDKYIFNAPDTLNKKPAIKTYDHFKYVALRKNSQENEIFKNFAKSPPTKAHNVSFSGLPNSTVNAVKSIGFLDKYIDLLAKGIGLLASSKPVKGLIEFCVRKEVDYTSHLASLSANCLTLSYMYNVWNSTKIEEEQKKPLMLNMFIGATFATIGGYTLNDWINKKIKPVELAMKHSEHGKTIMKGFQIARSLMVFQFLYRFITPVIATPIANHITNKLRSNKNNKG